MQISDLAKQELMLFGMYVTLYNEGSKFEHSDISTTKLYRKQIVDDYDVNQVFVFDLSQSNKECWLTVFKYSLMSIFLSYDAIQERIKAREEQLFWETEFGNALYTKADFNNITF